MNGFIFNYNIREDTMLGVGHVSLRRILRSCSACLRKLYYPWNRRQDN